MAIELMCGACQGRLLVETPGMTVVCPHCGVHLQTGPAPAPAVQAAPSAPAVVDPPAPPAPPAFVPPPSITPEVAPPPVVPSISAPPAPAVPPIVAPAAETTNFDASFAPAPPAADDAPSFDFLAPAAENTVWVPEPESAPAPAFNPGEGWTPEPQVVFEPGSQPEWDGQNVFAASESTPTFPDFNAPADFSAPAEFGMSAAGGSGTALQEAPPHLQVAAPREIGGTVVDVPAPVNLPAAAPAFPELQSPALPSPAAPVTVDVPQAAPASNQPAVAQPFAAPAPAEAAPPLFTATPASDPLAVAPALEAVAPIVPPNAVTEPVAAPAQAAVSPSALPEISYQRQRQLSATQIKLLKSWASAMTLACVYLIYLLMTSGGASKHNLESLPDLKPPRTRDKKVVTLFHVPPEAKMAPGHTLKLGESQRFGSLLVTPLRVTRGPIEFSHYDPNSKEKRAPTEPVLKLYVKFENVSADQEFPPLDRELFFSRELDLKTGMFRSNQFVCKLSDKKKNGERLLVYDLPAGSSWDLKAQDLERELKPGESFETYLPTMEEVPESLSGKLVWRVHFRKGYHPESFRGVTTLVEVVFDSSDIEPESTTTNAGAAAVNATGHQNS